MTSGPVADVGVGAGRAAAVEALRHSAGPVPAPGELPPSLQCSFKNGAVVYLDAGARRGQYRFRALRCADDSYGDGVVNRAGDILESKVGPMVHTPAEPVEAVAVAAVRQAPQQWLDEADRHAATFALMRAQHAVAQELSRLEVALAELRRAELDAGAAQVPPGSARALADAMVSCGFDGTAAQLVTAAAEAVHDHAPAACPSPADC